MKEEIPEAPHPIERKIVSNILLGSILVAFLSILLMIYWLARPYDVLQVKQLPVPIDTQDVKAGQPIVLLYNYCKTMNVSGVMEVQAISQALGAAIDIPGGVERTEPACRNDLRVPMIMPAQAKPGKYHFHYKATYKVNPIREVVEEWDTQEFEVTE